MSVADCSLCVTIHLLHPQQLQSQGGKALEHQTALAAGCWGIPLLMLTHWNWGEDPPALGGNSPHPFPVVWLHKTFTHPRFFPVAILLFQCQVQFGIWGRRHLSDGHRAGRDEVTLPPRVQPSEARGAVLSSAPCAHKGCFAAEECSAPGTLELPKYPSKGGFCACQAPHWHNSL